MSTILRTLRNLRRIGFKEYGHQMQNIGDTKAGTLIGTDRWGNKFYENMAEELPRKAPNPKLEKGTGSMEIGVLIYPHSPDTMGRLQDQLPEWEPSQIEPGWHAWISYMVDAPPTQDKLLQTGLRHYEVAEHRPNLTQTRAAFKTYSTTRPKYSAWTPVAAPR
ncbi:NADH-ubiquinone oxidoreductase subunit B17.2 [Penicillium frequentans]|nr:NADH-ubiquinone oxidoreductase subunit B17.2 [Penicillium glabrum]